MASPLPATETVVDLTADDGDDEPVAAAGTASSSRASNELRSRSSTANVSPEKQFLDASLRRSQQLLAARSPSRPLAGASPSQPAAGGSVGTSPMASRLASPSKQSSKSDHAPAAAPSSSHSTTETLAPGRKLSTPVVLSSSSSVGDAADPEPRRSSRTSGAKRPSAPPAAPKPASRSGASSEAVNPGLSTSVHSAEVEAEPSAPRSPSVVVTASSHTIQTATVSRVQTPSPKKPVPAPYFADLGSTPKDVKPIISFIPPSAQRPLRVIKDDAGQDIIDLEDTDDEEQSDGGDDDDDDDEDSDGDGVGDSGGEPLGPSDGEGLGTEDDGRATGDDSGAEGDEDDEEEDDDGETDADISAMEIDNHLLDGTDGGALDPGGLEAKLDALHEANTSPRPPLVGTPQRNASAGPSNHNGPRVPGFQSGSSDFTSPASSVVPRSGVAGAKDSVHHPIVKKKIKHARAKSPTMPAVPVKPDITLRLEHPIKLNEYTEFSLYEKALDMGQYDEATVAHFSPSRILQTVQAKRDLDVTQSSKKRKRSSGVALANETPEEILARGLEEKYGAKKKRHTVNKEDYYDLDDGFVDDSTAMVDVPEYAGIPVEEGFYVAVGAIELRGEEEEDPDERHCRKPRKGSVDSSSDAASKPKAPIKRRQTNLSHLLHGDDGASTGAGPDGMQGVEITDGYAAAATSAPIPFTSVPLSTPISSAPAASTSISMNGSLAVPAAATTTTAPLPPTSPFNPVVLSSGSTGEAPVEAPVVKAEPSLSQRPKSASVKPEVPIPTPLIGLVQELRQKIKEHDWSNKKVFPEHLRPVIHRLVEAAIKVNWYGQDFFDLMPKIFPYNRFTMLVLIRRQEFHFHEALLQEQRARLVEQWRHEVDEEAKIQVPKYQAALKDWEEKKGRLPFSTNGPPGSPSAVTSHTPGAGANTGPPPILPAGPAPTGFAPGGPTDQHSPDLGLSQLPFVNGGPPTPSAKATSDEKAPQRKMRLTSSLRETLWTLFNITEEILELTNEFNGWESKKPESGLKLRKTLYSDLASCFPEGFVHTTDLSRAVSQLKLKYDRKDEPLDD